MNDSLFGFSIDEVNSDPERLKTVLINYSSNVKSYAKWFEINEIDKNEEKFTLYKVIYRFLPKDLNESVKEVVVWKRFRDFKELYEFMHNYHVSLHRKDKFPDFPKAKFFNRFDDQVISERKEAILRLLQFIGSQSHLYRHEKFIEFLSDGKFFDHANSNLNLDRSILRPTRLDVSSPIDRLKNLNSEIKNHLSNRSQESNFVDAYLAKTVKLIELAIENENSDYHLTTLKFLNNSSNILSDCVNELERSNFPSTRLVFLRSINSKLIDVIRLLSEKNRQNEESVKKNESLESPAGAKFLNDWVVDDFNLKSDDFSNELSFISGNLFDLSFNFKLFRVLNYNCFLLQTRFDQANGEQNDKFILKRLGKSNNPKVTKKSIVPFANKIPYMCQLQKYYESDTTIFLLIEYFEHGLLYNHLHFYHQNPENFFKDLKNIKKLTRQESNETIRENSLHRRNSLSTIHISYSSNQLARPKRRTQSEMHERKTIYRLESFSENQLTEVNLPDFKLNEVTSSESISSSSSLSDTDTKTEPDSVVISVKNENKKMSKIKDFLKLKSDNKKSVIFFKANNLDQYNQNHISKSDSQSSHDEKTNSLSSLYSKQVKIWLAQLIIVVKNLHKTGLVLKDLNWRNLLLDKNGTLLLTYFSSWNLVERKLSTSALDEMYVAPELNGLVNYEVSEVCDWWSVGVIAYEMLTLRKFTDIHSISQIYVEKIMFGENFKNKKAQFFIKQMLRLNPNERLSIEQIESHSFFKNVDWVNLENSFWTRN